MESMDLGLTDKVAIVTAASRGFGRAIARQLAEEGAHVVICARGAENLADAAAEIDRAGRGRVVSIVADLADPETAELIVAETRKKLGPVDLCVVNNGGPPAGGWSQLRISHFDAAYRVLIETALRMCRQVLPEMMDRQWGRIVQIASVTVRQPVEGLTLSNVMRPAVHALTRTLAIEAAGSGVTVNTVAPGYHLTSRMEEVLASRAKQEERSREDVLDELAAEIPAGRFGRPEEIAALVAFLASAAAGYITGQCIVADGGWVRATF
jgi:3-oxoacyl-[acyl-carrier protein] reductase